MRKRLTAISLSALKPEQKRYEVGDIEPGLYVIVFPTGRKSFVVRLKHMGKSCRVTLGNVDDISLSDAREMARDVLRKSRAGINPAEEKQEAKAALKDINTIKQSGVNKVENAIKTYIELHVSNLNSSKEVIRMFNYDVIPKWKGRELQTITKADVLTLLNSVKGRGSKTMANRLLANLRAFFNWAISIDYAGLTTSPCQGIKAPSPEVRRDRVLTDDELKLILLASKKIDEPWGKLFKLLILTGVRRSEASEVKMSEFSFKDESKAEWLIPSARTKNGRAHLLPVTSDVVDLINSVTLIDNCDYVFSVTGKTPLSGFSDAKERLERIMFDLSKKLGIPQIEPWRFHDIRRTVATGMARLGIAPHVVEAVLNHVSGAMAGVAGVYNRHGYYIEKKQALEVWAKHIKTLENEG